MWRRRVARTLGDPRELITRVISTRSTPTHSPFGNTKPFCCNDLARPMIKRELSYVCDYRPSHPPCESLLGAPTGGTWGEAPLSHQKTGAGRGHVFAGRLRKRFKTESPSWISSPI